MKFEVRWSDIGQPLEAGLYSFRSGHIELLRRHIKAWEHDPDGIWEVHGIALPRGRTKYAVRLFKPSAGLDAAVS